MAHRFFRPTEEWKNQFIVRDISIRGDVLDGVRGMDALAEALRLSPHIDTRQNSPTFSIHLSYVNLGGADGIRALSRAANFIGRLHLQDCDFGDSEGFAALCELVTLLGNATRELIIESPRYGGLPQYCTFGRALCDFCGESLVAGTHFPPIVDLCTRCYKFEERPVLSDAQRWNLERVRNVLDVEGLLATGIHWSSETRSHSIPGADFNQLWTAMRSTRLRRLHLDQCNLLGGGQAVKDSFTILATTGPHTLEGITISSCAVNAANFVQGLHHPNCTLNSLCLHNLLPGGEDLAVALVTSNCTRAVLWHTPFDARRIRVDAVQRSLLRRLIMIEMDPSEEGRLAPLCDMLPFYPNLHTVRLYESSITTASLTSLSKAVRHPLSKLFTVSIPLRGGLTANDRAFFWEIERCILVRTSLWMAKLCILLRALTCVDSTGKGLAFNVLNPDMVRLIARFLPMDVVTKQRSALRRLDSSFANDSFGFM